MATIQRSSRFGGVLTPTLYADFEAGPPSGSSVGSGSINAAFTPPIAGTYSLRVPSGNNTLFMPLPAAQPTVWVTFLFYYETTNTATRHILSLRDVGAIEQLIFYTNTSQQFLINIGGVTATTGFSYVTGTVYRVWLEYIKGTNSGGPSLDAIGRCYIADASSDLNVARPSTADLTITTGARYNNVTHVVTGGSTGINGGNKVFDNIAVYNTETS